MSVPCAHGSTFARRPVFRVPAVAPLVLAVCFGLAGCQPEAPPAVSLEDAKNITAQFAANRPEPPRKISDIAKILAVPEKTDSRIVQESRKIADQEYRADSGSDPVAFYRRRSLAAEIIGRPEQARDDWWKASRSVYEDPQGGGYELVLLRDLAWKEYDAGNYRSAVDIMKRAFRIRGSSIRNRSIMAEFSFALGDAKSAERNGTYAIERGYPCRVPCARFNTPVSHYAINAVKGKWAEAEHYLRETIRDYEDEWREGTAGLGIGNFSLAEAHQEFSEQYLAIKLSRWRNQLVDILLRQGRNADAEYEARRHLRHLLEIMGKNNAFVAESVTALGGVLLAQGRQQDAERLGNIALNILQEMKAPPRSRSVANIRRLLGKTMMQAGQWQKAAWQFDQVRQALSSSPSLFQRWYGRDIDIPFTLHRVGRNAEALRILNRAIRQLVKSYGARHRETLEARALRAVILASWKRTSEALEIFSDVMPDLLKVDILDTQPGADRRSQIMRLRYIVEGYLELLADPAHADPERALTVAANMNSGLAQLALAESSARAAARDPALQDLVRREQDARQESLALSRVMSEFLKAPATQRVGAIISRQRNRIAQLNAARETLYKEIARRFPAYANLVNPGQISVKQIGALLHRDEALIVIHTAQKRSYVWVVRKAARLAFSSASLGADDMARIVGEIRRAVTPQVQTLGDIPPFDVGLSYRLYRDLLAPVEDAWRDRTSLLVVANGALSRLPFSLLVTENVTLPEESGALFSRYRAVPFLARRHAVTALPDVRSLTSLRAVPATAASRRPFVGFGDPYFNERQAAEGSVQEASRTAMVARNAGFNVRGMPVHLRSAPRTENLDSAELAKLPRLPETAAEIRSIAAAMKADPEGDIFIGVRATEDAVKTANLAGYKVVAFATHGLVPGDLDGLQQPALAFTMPRIGKSKEDGILTMGEVLGLRLNADWVVLSACNTGAENGAGAEAFSGLGQAFFYAGTRAVLLTHWPVETTSAKYLTTNLFAHQAHDTALSRSQALRLAMLSLIDGKGLVDKASGRTVFSYAHPIFWAPFALVGDGGGGTPGG